MAKVLKLQHQSFQWIFRVDFLLDWLVWSLCFPRDPQESSPKPQFKTISSLGFSFLYGPTLTFIHDYWRKRNLVYPNLCWKILSLLFNMLSRFVTAFLPRSKHLLISLAAVTICSDFGAQGNKVCHCFHFFPFYLPWSDGTRLGKVSFHSNHKERQCQRMLKLLHNCTHLTC